MALGWSEAESFYSRYLLTVRSAGPRTVTTYTYNLHHFWRLLEEKGIDVANATKDHLEEWFATKRLEVVPSTAHYNLVAVRAFYQCLIRRGLRSDDPTEGMWVKRQEPPPEPPFTEAEMVALIQAIFLPRDKLITMLLAATGKRVSEIVGMYAEHVDYVQGWVRTVTKGGKVRYFYPPRHLLNRVRVISGGKAYGTIWYTQTGKQLTAKEYRQNLKAAADRAGLKNVHPHRFRSSYAIEMLRFSGGDIQAVQELLGHDSIVSTQRYTAYDKERRARELAMAHDLAARLS